MVHFSRVKLFHTTLCKLKQYPRNLKGKDTASQKWIFRQINDKFVKKAREDNYRCRSAFKLLEIDDKFNILEPGKVVIECGAAPGSWTQVAVSRINSLGSDPGQPTGHIIGVDLQHIMPIPGATLLSNSDFTANETQLKILKLLNGREVDLVLSDMAPNRSCIKQMDHDVIIDLCTKALFFSVTILKNGGTFLCKIWQGAMQKQLENLLLQGFETVKVVKPEASRSDSAETFLLARKFKLK